MLELFSRSTEHRTRKTETRLEEQRDSARERQRKRTTERARPPLLSGMSSLGDVFDNPANALGGGHYMCPLQLLLSEGTMHPERAT